MKKHLLLGAAVLLFVSIGGNKAHASIQDLHGWAWSSNIGWISFNSADTGAGGGPYKVTVDTSNGAMNGFAWSPNIGWVAFGDDADPAIQAQQCPQPADDPTLPYGCDAVVDLSIGQVTGWGHVVGKGIGDDTWIQLSGTNHLSGSNGGVAYSPSNGKFRGYAWEPTETGWVDFSGVSCPGCVNAPMTATCTGVAQTGGTDLYTATAVGGSGTYSYSWNNGPFSSNNTFTDGITYDDGATIPGPTLQVRDNTINPTLNITCPSISASNPFGNGKLILNIGHTLAEAQSKNLIEITVQKGATFALSWTNTFPNNIHFKSCTGAIQNNNGSNNWNQWNPQGGNGNVGGLTTSGVKPGDYIFNQSCNLITDVEGVSVQAQVVLHVKDKTIGEF